MCFCNESKLCRPKSGAAELCLSFIQHYLDTSIGSKIDSRFFDNYFKELMWGKKK